MPQCSSCGRTYQRSYCEYCQREARWWHKYRNRAITNHLPPRLQRELQVRQVDVGDWPHNLRDGGGLFLYGGVGTGKSTAAAATAVDVLRLRMVEGVGPGSFVWANTANLLASVRATYKQGAEEQEQDVIARYARADLLVLDDLDDVSPTDWAIQTLDYLVNYRYEHLLPLIVTSNVDGLDGLASALGQDRIASRLRQMCRSVGLGGEDNRRAS